MRGSERDVGLTGSQRTICLWFQGELPVDTSIFSPVTYRTLLALWDFLLDTCRSAAHMTNTYTRRQPGTLQKHTWRIFPVRGSRTRTRLSLDVTANLLPSLLKLTDSSSASDG